MMRFLLMTMGCLVSTKDTVDTTDTPDTEVHNCEICDGKDNNGDGNIDEGFGDGDADGKPDCMDEETCDGFDNDGDGDIDESFPDTDQDGTADCIDKEECDGLDNNGDGVIDDGFIDTDGDGIADCDAENWCDGKDNDGDGSVDEGYPDTDGDGIADCIDPEECDGLDNNGDGSIDEGFDNNGDGIGDCLQESCNCEDDNGDGNIDEGLDCSYDVTMRASADDRMSVYLDGQAAGSSAGWSALYNQTFSLSAGTHHLSVDASDNSGVIAGFNARLDVPGHTSTDYDTGNGRWLMSVTDPAISFGSAWRTGAATSVMFPDSNALATSYCNGVWNFSPSGAAWVWSEDCDREDVYKNNWFYLEIEVCQAATTEVCDGIDNNGDGKVDEGFTDSDFDGEADCMEEETCDGLDNNGDGQVDEGYADTDADGIADCVDAEECDGLDNNGDGFVDEDYADTDADGIADCIDVEECDGLDNNGDGRIDEGMSDVDNDGIVDCQDEETCGDDLDNNGDGQLDEGFLDTDNDGIPDCIDTEDCDGQDNNGDGRVDEGFMDSDGDGLADCIDPEICNCIDDDGDGEIDQGLNCGYDVALSLSADDAFEVWYDGTSIGSAIGWSIASHYSIPTTLGHHQIAVAAHDVGHGLVGFNASVEVPGWGASDWNTGLGVWEGSHEDPAIYGASATWTTQGYSAMVSDANFLATNCLLTWGSTGAGPSGGDWVWMDNCSDYTRYPSNWYFVEVDVCPALSDIDGDGFTVGEDCDDNDNTVYPGAAEICDDTVDNDCDPTTDCDGFCIDSIDYPESCDSTPSFSGANPLLYWDLDSVSTNLSDSSGHGYTGTLSSGWSSINGVSGSAGQLNGSAYATTSPGTPSSWTISQWVHVDSLPSSGFTALSTLGNGNPSYSGWEVFVNSDGRPGVYVEGGGGRAGEVILYGTTPVCTGDWTMITASYVRGVLTLYVDGVYANSVTTSYTSLVYGTLPFAIGYDPNQNSRYLSGALDEVGLWSSALSDAEIAELFEDGACHRSSL